MKATEAVQVRTETHGRVPQGIRELAAAKISSLFRTAAEPVLTAHVTLTVAADPAVTRPAVAQVTIDMNGRIVRAQAAEGPCARPSTGWRPGSESPRAGGAELGGTARNRADDASPANGGTRASPARPSIFHGPLRNVRWSAAPATRPTRDPAAGGRRAGPARLRLPPVRRALDHRKTA